METILDLNCEDVMLELVLKYLVPCTHIMLSQRSRIKQVDSYCKSADIFLSLMPDVFKYVLYIVYLSNFCFIYNSFLGTKILIIKPYTLSIDVT